jgi:hypothetical protein
MDSPDRGDQSLMSDGALRTIGKIEQQLKFFGGQVNRAACDRHPKRLRVNSKIACMDETPHVLPPWQLISSFQT